MERLGLDCRRDSLFNMSANTTQTFRNFIVIESWRIGMRRLTRNDGLNPLSHHLLSGRVPMMTLVHTLAVAEYLNFRHAANALGVAQSSVSARVKA
ncbi:helix-turn-helix domain-containing protein, partial [Pseudomonas aeruginosa]